MVHLLVFTTSNRAPVGWPVVGAQQMHAMSITELGGKLIEADKGSRWASSKSSRLSYAYGFARHSC